MQGDGEISLTALETRMQELRTRVILHKQEKFAWPIAETPTHWIILGLDKDLNTAMVLAARNAIAFLVSRAKMTPNDAYGLCSIAVRFSSYPGRRYRSLRARADPEEPIHR